MKNTHLAGIFLQTAEARGSATSHDLMSDWDKVSSQVAGHIGVHHTYSPSRSVMMIRRSSHRRAGTAGMLLAALLCAPIITVAREPSLARVIPDDVLLFIAGYHNPERTFVNDYWCDVFDTVKDSGIGDDLMGLIGSLLGEGGTTELTRLKERAAQLLAGVNWEQLGGGEMVFAERLPPPIQAFSGRSAVWMPNMVWIFRGSGEGAAENFHGLSAILEAMAEEINGAIDSQVLVVKRSSRSGATIAEVNLLAALPGAPAISLSAAHRGDLVMIALGERRFPRNVA